MCYSDTVRAIHLLFYERKKNIENRKKGIIKTDKIYVYCTSLWVQMSHNKYKECSI